MWEDCTEGEQCSTGEDCTAGPNCSLGADCTSGPHCSDGANCTTVAACYTKGTKCRKADSSPIGSLGFPSLRGLFGWRIGAISAEILSLGQTLALGLAGFLILLFTGRLAKKV